jgi:hypothetical protein
MEKSKQIEKEKKQSILNKLNKKQSIEIKGHFDEKSLLNFYQGRGSLVSQITDSPGY